MRLRDTVAAAVMLGLMPAAWGASPDKIDAQLQTLIKSSSSTAFLDALVVLKDNAAISMKIETLARRQPDLRSRYHAALGELERSADSAQSALLDELRAGVRRRTIAEFKPYWITNAIYIQALPEEILRLAGREDVERVMANLRVEMIEPVGISAAAPADQGPTPNLIAVGAEALWSRGLTGKGRLVCSFDTGVEGTHPALANQWRGRYTADSAACWFDPLKKWKSPVDEAGHGTHVMGIMVGHDGADTVGLAPDARWISAAVVDRGLQLGATIHDLLNAFEWAANPDGDPQTMEDVPDVVCNSWGIPKNFIDQCDDTFWDAIDNLEALGIVCVFAAGNEGVSGSVTTRNPADRATSPLNSFAVGAVDSTFAAVPLFSSRGPSSCDWESKKPEVVAPGADVRSSYKGGIYKLMKGTSMAAPHVAAAVALFRQYNPELTPEQIKSAILLSAVDIGDPGEDNESGMGFIDLAAALGLLPPVTIPQPQIENVVFTDGRNNLPDPGDAGDLVVTLRGETANAPNLIGYLFTTTPGVMVSKDTAYFGTLSIGGTEDNTGDPFGVSFAPAFKIGDTVLFTLTLTGDSIPGYQQRNFAVVVGVPYYGKWTTVDLGAAAMTVSNFGAFGLHDSSYIPLGGRGFVDAAGRNLLHEAGLALTAGTGKVVDEIRIDGAGTYGGDFRPVSRGAITLSAPGKIGDRESITAFDDSGADTPLGVVVRQRAAALSGTPERNAILLEWTVTNRSGAKVNNLSVGLFSDWDIPGDYHSDLIVVDAGEDLFYQYRPGATAVVGVALLNVEMSAARFLENGAAKRGFTESEKSAALRDGIHAPSASVAADWCGFVAAGPYRLPPGDSVTVAVALCAGESVAEFYAAVADARDRYLLATGVGTGGDGVPRVHELVVYPNYPNPFNPETRIDFVLPGEGHAEVAVYNVLGQKVATLSAGNFAAGPHTVVWKGRDDCGNEVSSGVYLCRVSTAAETRTRKMVLLR